MTNKDNLQKEIKDKVKPGIKPSHLRKSKSCSDIPAAPPLPNTPLQKSKSQLEIPIANQPTPQQQINQLQDQIKFHAQTAQNYLQSLQSAQVKITELEEELKTKISHLEEQILELRLDKIKDFGDYLEKKQELASELELNISEGVNEIKRLENKLLATNKKKLALQSQLSQSEIKYAQLKLKSLDNQEPSSNSHFYTDYWPVLLIALLYCGSAWLLSKNTSEN